MAGHQSQTRTETYRERRSLFAGHASLQSSLAAGATAGLIAGIVMAMVAMIRAAAVGMGFWLPPKLIAATFYGVDALVGDAGVIIVGLMIHMVTSIIFGAIFGLLGGGRLTMGAALGGGLVYGFIIWAVMTFIGLPLVNDVMSERMAMQSWWWFAYHLIYGAALLLTPPLARAFSGRKES